MREVELGESTQTGSFRAERITHLLLIELRIVALYRRNYYCALAKYH